MPETNYNTGFFKKVLIKHFAITLTVDCFFSSFAWWAKERKYCPFLPFHFVYVLLFNQMKIRELSKCDTIV